MVVNQRCVTIAQSVIDASELPTTFVDGMVKSKDTKIGGVSLTRVRIAIWLIQTKDTHTNNFTTNAGQGLVVAVHCRPTTT